MGKLIWRAFTVVCLLVMGWFWGDAALIYAKAQLAPVLIRSAWADTLDTGKIVKPWPWADTWPVARLQIPALSIDQFVLHGANGASLPFGPGHLSGTALPGKDGTVVIAAHRDTHFDFLPDLKPGYEIYLQGLNGMRRTYRLRNQEIVDSRHAFLAAHRDLDQLILVTCEPTGVIRYRGPWRLIAIAERVADDSIISGSLL